VLSTTIIGKAESGDSETFLEWWIDRWNAALGELCDPATHRSPDGTFDPALMLGRFFTHHRLLACVQGILADTGRNDFSRMELLFESLDLIEGLGCGLGDWSRLANPGKVERDFARIVQFLEPNDEVGRVVLPRCERAIEALQELRAGFRGPRSHDIGQDEMDREVSGLLRAMRNAGHGLSGNRSRNSLLALMSHRSELSPDLPNLAWLHLIRLLCFGHWRRPD